MGLVQVGCLAWIHLALALTVSGLSKTELFDYGVQHGDQFLSSGPDQTVELALDQTLFFFKNSYDTIYVSLACFFFLISFECMLVVKLYMVFVTLYVVP